MRTLKEIYKYFNYPSKDKLYKIAKKEGLDITYKKIDLFLKKQNISQVFSRKKPRRKGHIIAYHPYERFQMDLIDLTKFGLKNKGYYWLLLLIDIFTRKIFVYAMKDKTTENIHSVLEKFLSKYHPEVIISDNETGFKSKAVGELMAENEIVQNLIDPQDHKALGVLDRAVQTLKNAIFKHMKDENTTTYIDELSRIVDAYNSTPHIGINNISPDDAYKKENIEDIQMLNYKKDIVNKKGRVIFEVGDKVRIKIKQNAFSRSYDETYSDKIYTIKSIDENVALLNDGEEVSLRRLVKVEDIGEEERTIDALNEVKKESKINRKLNRDGVDTSNIITEGRRRR